MANDTFHTDGVPVRLFHPTELQSNAGIIFFHGGGWMHGSVDEYAPDTQNLANQTGMKLISVEYRKPPKHIYPVPLEDCLTATKCIMNHASDWNIDPKKIVIAGDSAGGNLALTVVLKLRDTRFHHEPEMLVLLYPCLQIFDFFLPSYSFPEYPGLDKHTMIYFWLMYGFGKNDYHGYLMRNTHVTIKAREAHKKLMDFRTLPEKYIEKEYKRPDPPRGNEELWNIMKELVLDQYFAPGMASDLTNLPQTYILTAGQDPLRDEGIIFAKRLSETANSTVRHEHYRSLQHGELFEHPELLKHTVHYIKFAEPLEYNDTGGDGE